MRFFVLLALFPFLRYSSAAGLDDDDLHILDIFVEYESDRFEEMTTPETFSDESETLENIFIPENVPILAWCLEEPKLAMKILSSMQRMPDTSPYMVIEGTLINYESDLTPLQVHFYRYFLFSLITGEERDEIVPSLLKNGIIDRKMALCIDGLNLYLHQFYLRCKSFDMAIFNLLSEGASMEDDIYSMIIALKFGNLDVVFKLLNCGFDADKLVILAMHYCDEAMLPVITRSGKFSAKGPLFLKNFLKARKAEAIFFAVDDLQILYMTLSAAHKVDPDFGCECVTLLVPFKTLHSFLTNFTVHLVRKGLQRSFNVLAESSVRILNLIGFNLYCEAIRYNQLNMITLILIAKFPVNLKGPEGKSALVMAVERGLIVPLRQMAIFASEGTKLEALNFAVENRNTLALRNLINFFESVHDIQHENSGLLEYVMKEELDDVMDVFLSTGAIDPLRPIHDNLNIFDLSWRLKNTEMQKSIQVYCLLKLHPQNK